MNAVLKRDAVKFANFIQAHYPDARTWQDPVGYCAWYISNFFIAAVCDEANGEIVAIAAARPVDRPGMGVLPAYFNRDGICLHVDFLVDVSPDSRAINVLAEIAKMRFPQCNVVSMFRHFESKMSVYPANKFWWNLGKIKRTKREKRYELVEH